MFSPSVKAFLEGGQQHLLSLSHVYINGDIHAMFLLLGPFAIFYRSQNGLLIDNKIKSNKQFLYTTLCILSCLLFSPKPPSEVNTVVYHRSLST